MLIFSTKEKNFGGHKPSLVHSFILNFWHYAMLNIHWMMNKFTQLCIIAIVYMCFVLLEQIHYLFFSSLRSHTLNTFV